MNNFITFENSVNKFEYFFNKNHFLILFISLVIIIFFSMYLARQRFRVQKAGIIILSLLLLILEACRIAWRYFYLKHNGIEPTFFSITNLDFFTASMWVSIPLILFTAITKKKNNKNSRLLSFVFSVSTLFAIISLIYTNNININFDFYHCINLIYILQRSFIILLGLLFAFTKWASVKEFLDIWKGFFSLLAFIVVCALIGNFFGAEFNLFYTNYFPTFNSLGMLIASPWHYVALFGFLFFFQLLLYFPFQIYRIIRNKKGI